MMASILGTQHANIVNLTLAQRDESFHSFDVLIESCAVLITAVIPRAKNMPAIVTING